MPVTRAGLALLVTLLAASPAAGQDPPPPGVQLQAVLGLSRSPNDLPSGWAPLAVHLHNQGPARQVELEVMLYAHDTEVSWRWRRSVALSAGQRWRTWVYLPMPPGGRNVEVVCRDDPATTETSQVLARTGGIGFNVRGSEGYYGAIDRHVLVVSGPDLDQRDVSWLTRQTGNAWHTPTIQLALGRPEELPDRPEGFGCLDLLVLHDADLSGLSRAQQDALVTWVELGGNVLLVPARRLEFFRDPTVKRLLEGRTVRMHEVDALGWVEGTFGAFGGARGRDRFMVFAVDLPQRTAGSFGAEVLPDGSYTRFLSTLSCGAGTTWIVAADPTALPFQVPQSYFSLATQLGDELHAVPARGGLSGNEHPSLDPRLVRLVGVRRLPSQGLVVGLVLSFIICVAPLNYLYLRRRDAQMMLVVTIPAISLLWTGLILATGYVTKGLSTDARRATLLEVDLGRRAARELTAVSLVAAGAGDYEVRFAPGLLPTRLVRDWSELSSLSQDLREEDGGAVYPAISLGLWGQATFRAEARRTLPGPLVVTRTDGGLVVHNGTDLPLERVLYVDHQQRPWSASGVAPGAAVPLAPLTVPPGQTVDAASVLATGDEARRAFIASSLKLWSLSAQSGQLLATVETPPLAVTVEGRRPSVELMVIRALERTR